MKTDYFLTFKGRKYSNQFDILCLLTPRRTETEKCILHSFVDNNILNVHYFYIYKIVRFISPAWLRCAASVPVGAYSEEGAVCEYASGPVTS